MGNNFSDDPKKIYSLSKKAIEFIEEHEKNETFLSSNFSLYCTHKYYF